MVFLPALTLVAVVAAPMAETFKAGPGKEKFAGSAVVQPPAASIEQSLLANPAQPISWLNLGRIYASRRSDPLAFLNTWLPRADGCYLQAVSYAPFEPGVLFSAAGHFVERAATLAEEAGEGRGETIARFQEYYRRALAADPGLWQEAADRIWMFFPEERVVMGIVPEGMAELRDRVLRYVVRKGSE